MSDNQGLRMGLEVVIPQEALEQVAQAIPAIDLASALVSEIHGNQELLQGFIAAMLRELSKPRSAHLASALRDITAVPHPGA